MLHGHAQKRGEFSLQYQVHLKKSLCIFRSGIIFVQCKLTFCMMQSNLQNMIQKCVEYFTQRNIAHLQFIQASAELRALESRCQEQDTEMREANERLKHGNCHFLLPNSLLNVE